MIEPAGALKVQPEISISQSKPSWSAERIERLETIPGLVLAAPSLFWIRQIGERIGHGIDIRGDPQPEMVEIVRGVHDHGQRAGRQQSIQSLRKLGPAYATG